MPWKTFQKILPHLDETHLFVEAKRLRSEEVYVSKDFPETTVLSS
jgi:hypothetical protein